MPSQRSKSKPKGGGTKPEQSGISTEIKLPWGPKIKAKGFHAGAAICGSGLFYALIFKDPFSDPGQFSASLFLAFLAGLFVAFGLLTARLSESLKEKDRYRKECDRIADAKREIESELLSVRISSERERNAKNGGEQRKRKTKRSRNKTTGGVR